MPTEGIGGLSGGVTRTTRITVEEIEQESNAFRNFAEEPDSLEETAQKVDNMAFL